VSVPFIRPNAIFTIASLTEALGLRKGTIPRELRLGRLRFAKRAGRVLIMGSWVLQWIANAEVKRRRPTTSANGK
jgi:hypothetical protein